MTGSGFSPVEFLIDTGAGSTLLLGGDLKRLKIQVTSLRAARPVFGLTGSAPSYEFPARIVLQVNYDYHEAG